VTPDSVSYVPAYRNGNPLFGPAVHLGYWTTNSLPTGNYYVKLSGADSAGHSSSHTIWVVVSNGGMGGNFCGGPPGGGTGLGQGSIYVGSATGTILHLSEDLDSLDCFQVTDSGSNAYVTAVLEVGDDSLLVLDARNKRIHKLNRNGQKGRRLVSGLSLPVGVTRDESGNFWLVDKGLDRVGKFRRDGTLVFARGGPGRDSTNLNSPEAIAVKGSLVYVADSKNSRIAVWDTSGNYVAAIKGDFANPTAVMVTDSGAIYLTDGSDGEIKGITPLGGNIVAGTASGGSKLRGLVLSENGHSVFTLAPQPNTVYKLRIQSDDSIPGGVQSQRNLNLPKLLSLAQPFPNPARTRLNISYALPRQTRVSVKLYDIAGKLVTTLASGYQKPGYYNLTWNRRDTKGRTCACGVYFCTLAAEGLRFSRKVVLTE
jgi:DNA-binding beta-propeller fold protein YncE